MQAQRDFISADIKKEMDRIRSFFPTQQALLLPLLHEIQRENGWLSPQALKAAAQYLELPLARVMETVTFYTMYNLQPVGKKHLQLCTNVSCFLNGAEKLKHCLEKRLGIECGETTKDGRYTLTEVECLAACGTAPVLQVNDDYHEGLNEESLNKLMDTLDRETARG